MSGPSLADIFNSTSPDFDTVTPLVWGPAGEALVDEVGLSPGDRVLDVCAGTGASALAAARVVGPQGSVVAVDFAADLIGRARAAADAAGLRNIDFRVDDVTALPGRDDGGYDALICGFGVFFLPDMDDTVRRLLTLLRPGGRLGFAVWHGDALYDFVGTFYTEVARMTGAEPPPSPRDPSDGPPHPITRIDTVDKITGWLAALGAVGASASVLTLRVPRTDEFSWSMVLGSGMRGALHGMEPQTVADLRDVFLRRLADDGMSEVRCDTLIATARRP
ncbi:methyltransferase domain-containing protein [Gordonia sp. HNM0687]|uniref:Methyltransferase domain-containing protein n=1 Tax=Gordonia mangrovi TaxID=2665643 RepID=A0A6L7GQ00_9ACTN|nr:methyltransferase domain-containing protein [Gordonia mangrovi]MXP20628.1 methyltransferase domain-containing protein [Gordonia mangrovi]UVF78791.1 methyltransferase domain-containing protein [Gordonia mangrovi]